jgi:hypothetical protein
MTIYTILVLKSVVYDPKPILKDKMKVNKRYNKNKSFSFTWG